jgi:hypothetical protein
VVEPRPVFVRGRLVYLVSIVPESANSVSKTVIVDAETNKVTEIFDNDTDPQAERKTLEFLRTGVGPQDVAGNATGASEEPTPASGDEDRSRETPRTQPGDVSKRLEDLVRRQREILRETQELQRELQGKEPAAAAP